ncbi:Na(+)/H(+) antiporter subunit C [Aquimixticola soesokkakensis]|uniref:Na(+)/H(+) antiporter subunit C n=1 Tax=Aquimixticola soesokkakensis TaxID=1519096 RepID=A0A1Y5RT48_9RHOB|nr:Na+/H+ antiporter subunit C [Aquimixticola soesokkakensis]SLN24418.1 Na(+)/H(+) antiporter subunit C [Aquimixticola soesokkakensis]
MEVVLALLAGLMVAAAVYLMLWGDMMRFLFGLMLMSNAVNLVIFASGRLTPGQPPLLGAGGKLPETAMANALPQALILTALVIGFGLFAFALVLALRAHHSFGHLEMNDMRAAEPVAKSADPQE